MTPRLPELAWRGVVEGFYGQPWTFDERMTFFEFAGEVGLTSYVYAPKFDPYHRDDWRSPYPAHELSELAELNRRAAANGVAFVYAISPALSMRFSGDDDHRALAAKCAQLWDAGVRSFALLFDDVPTELPHAEDRESFGDDAHGAGRAHGHAAARFRDEFLAPRGVTEPLLVCPTDYAGTAASPYRTGLAERLPADARVLWTGSDIVVGEITRTDIDRAADSYGRELVLWDNFPVNDFDRSRVFLGPLTGRPGDVAGSRLAGIVANPMVEAAPSRFALSAVADWASDPAAYDASAAAERSFARVANGVESLRALVAVTSSWPPSAAPSPEVAALLEPALNGDSDSLEQLGDWMRRLAQTSADGAPDDLAAGLAPWVRAARAAGEAGALACHVLAGAAADADLLRELIAARTRFEAEYANVVRAPVAELIAAAIARLGGDETAPYETGDADSRFVAPFAVHLLTGANPSPGDRELAEFLGASGHRVTISAEAPAAGSPLPDLVVVTRSGDEETAVAAGRLAVPLIAWAHTVALGLATESVVALALDSIEIVEPSHPAAAALTGRVGVYVGPSKLTWSEPGADAVVVAREPEAQHPVIALYGTGSSLADGSAAPAPRAVAFLGPDGFAPWLVTAEARALVLALVRTVGA
ncbi:protein O-GlcNAcase [Leifsonia sp. NPDC058292]|uniref:protein O-GlcNAcase n=1 Tax=Leifsonia sp. NPDC058292 TaxID=3346428 RepID=UPI0036D7634F